MESRGYGIGERAPSTLEDPETERRRRIFWTGVKVWAFRPGGKF